jgi:hypothetical protein
MQLPAVDHIKPDWWMIELRSHCPTERIEARIHPVTNQQDQAIGSPGSGMLVPLSQLTPQQPPPSSNHPAKHLPATDSLRIPAMPHCNAADFPARITEWSR